MWKWFVLPAFYLLYWGICFLCTGGDKKNLAGLRSYPKEVQDLVREKCPLEAPKKKSLLMILLSNFLLFSIVFFLLGVLYRFTSPFDDYLSCFLYFLLFIEGLGLFDLLIIDLLWWRNTKRIRFSYLPNKSLYQDPHEHIASFLRGIPLFCVVALVASLSYFL